MSQTWKTLRPGTEDGVALGKKYDASSKEARLGNRFKDFVLTELCHLGIIALDFRSYLLNRWYSEQQANDMEQLEGDIFLIDQHIFLECKTSKKWRDSVTVKGRQLHSFVGPHKFYVTSYFDGNDYVDVRVHDSKDVRYAAQEKNDGEFYTFDTRHNRARELRLFAESVRRRPK